MTPENQERLELASRFHASMTSSGFTATQIIGIVLAWMPIERLRQMVEVREEKTNA